MRFIRCELQQTRECRSRSTLTIKPVFAQKNIAIITSLILKISLAAMLVSCSSLLPTPISTPLPAEFLPTAAALTLSASGALDISNPQDYQQPTDSGIINSTLSVSAEFSSTPVPPTKINKVQSTSEPTIFHLTQLTATSLSEGSNLTETVTPHSGPDTEPSIDLLYSTITSTPGPPIPNATIQILQLGALSKVASPIPVSTRLTCGEGKTIRFELYGEDGRILARYMRTYEDIPWNTARIGFNMDFEIRAAAELGRLVVSAEDSYGRLIEATSLDLILMSQGASEINPPTALQQRIIIQDPTEKSLIQTGKLIVSGRAKPATNQPLRAMLVGENGKILGQRLAGIFTPIPGDYGSFIAEVPYSVTEVTPALLMVFEEGGTISPYTFLTSIPVLLAP